MSNQDALEWVEGTFGLEPHWGREPDIDTISHIVRKQLDISPEIAIKITFHSKGVFTKLYKASTPTSTHLMCVSLPVDPHNRTSSAVSTIEHVQQSTSLPGPHVLAYSSSNSNELGFEWILMNNIPGDTLYRAWRKLPWAAKEALVKQLAEYQAQMFERRFQKIGNLYKQDETFVVDRLVTTISIQGHHLTHNVVRGPFASSYEWLKARLQLVFDNQQRILSTSCDEDEIEDADFAHNLVTRLLEILPTVFLHNVGASEPTVLFHNTLSMHNTMVDDQGKVTAFMDWEGASTVPLWRACQLPSLLEDRDRDTMPSKEDYSPDSDEEDDADRDGLENDGITDLYWEHLLEYELTKLRKLFVEKMEELSPAWITVMRQNTLKADFEKAVQDCDNGWRNKVVKRWVDSLAEGEHKSLTDMLFSEPEIDQVSQTSMDWEEA